MSTLKTFTWVIKVWHKLFLERDTIFYIKTSVVFSLFTYIVNYFLPNSTLHEVQDADLYLCTSSLASDKKKIRSVSIPKCCCGFVEPSCLVGNSRSYFTQVQSPVGWCHLLPLAYLSTSLAYSTQTSSSLLGQRVVWVVDEWNRRYYPYVRKTKYFCYTLHT